MSAQTLKRQSAQLELVAPVNEVRLVGRISQQPEERLLPSGDTIWAFRVVVTRTGDRGKSKQPVDSLECVVWTGRVRRSVAAWGVGDVVEVVGAMRRRFFRVGGSAVSRVEVEVTSGRLMRRARTG